MVFLKKNPWWWVQSREFIVSFIKIAQVSNRLDIETSPAKINREKKNDKLDENKRIRWLNYKTSKNQSDSNENLYGERNRWERGNHKIK